jgi:hypothetical protein
MRHPLCFVATLCFITFLMTACDTPQRPSITPTTPTPVPDSLSFPEPVVTPIKLGEVVKDVIKTNDTPCTIVSNRWPVPCRNFLVTATASATLVATLTWDVAFTDMILLLRIGETDFFSERPWSPHVVRVKTVAGQQYRIGVGLAGTGWEGGPFTLTTHVER